MKKRFLIILFQLTFLQFQLSAQQKLINTQVFNFPEKFNPDYGGICEDDKGFIWLATNTGLIRFDGLKTELFTSERHGLFSNNIHNVINGPNGMLWIKYASPIENNYYFEVINPHTLEVSTVKDILKTKFPFNIHDDHLNLLKNQIDENILIYDKKKVYEYNGHQLQEKYSSREGAAILQVIKSSQNNLWILAYYEQDSLFHLLYIKDGVLIEDTKFNKKMDFFNFDYINDHEQIVFTHVTNNKSAQYIKKPFLPRSKFHFLNKEHYDIQILNPLKKELWCFKKNEKNSLSIFNQKGEFITKVYNRNVVGSLEQTNSMRKYYCDSHGRLWFLRKNGVFMLEVLPNNFKQLLSHFPHNTKYSHSTRGITHDIYGTLYINSSHGIFYRKKDKSDFSRLSFPPEILAISTAIESEINGLVWFSTYNGEILEYNPILNKYKIYTYDNQEPFLGLFGRYWDFHRDKLNRLWVGFKSGLAYIDTLTNKIVPFSSSYNLGSVYYIHENQQGIWLLSSTGIYLMNYQYKIINHYHVNGIDTNHLVHNYIVHLYESPEDNTFWLASFGGGLIKWNYKTGNQTQYTTENGLSNNGLYAIYPDDHGNLWLSSNNGLNCFNPMSQENIIFLEPNGITHNEFNTTSHYKDQDGRIYFGTLNGVTVFHPNDLLEYNTELLQIVSAKKSNYSTLQNITLTAEVIKNNKIQINPSDREISINFTLLDYSMPKQTQYAYKIIGLDKEWTYTNSPEINLSRLRYGNHRLLVKAKKTGQKWIKKPLEIELHIVPPFYFRWWFILLSIICTGLLIKIIIQLRLKNLTKYKLNLEATVAKRTEQIENDKKTIELQARELKEIDHLKSQFFTNISHELRTPLTLIVGPLAYLRENIELISPEQVSRQLKLLDRNSQHLLNLVEEILDLAKLDVHKIELDEQTIDLSAFSQWIYLMFESKTKQQEVSFVIDFQVENDIYIIIDKKKTTRILINLIANAIKFTPAYGQIIFQINEINNEIQFKVKDTGKGIKASDLPHIFKRFYQAKENNRGGNGIGLALSKEFANILGGSLEVSSVFGQGATFTFCIPKKIGIPKDVGLPDKITTPTLEKAWQQQEKCSQKPTILIVEDNPDMQLFISTLLEPYYNTTIQRDGKAAQHYLQTTEELPSIILSDIMMPRMNGIELLEWLKAEENKLNSIPVIMLTAKTALHDKINALTIGVDDYLTKPFTSNELLARIKNLIKNSVLRTIETEKKNHVEDNYQTIESASDREWIKEIEEIAAELCDDIDLDVATFAKSAKMSLRSLQRKIKKVTGLTLSEYLREIRLQKARIFLEEGTFTTISETAYASGFGTPTYFSKLYEQRFGKKVSDYFI